MRECVITVTFVNGQVMNRTTANQYFAQHLMKMFVKHDRGGRCADEDSQR